MTLQIKEVEKFVETLRGKICFVCLSFRVDGQSLVGIQLDYNS